jgi:branched-chain amino acid transport system permease protein
MVWGHGPQILQSPLALGDLNFGGVVLGVADVAVIVATGF